MSSSELHVSHHHRRKEQPWCGHVKAHVINPVANDVVNLSQANSKNTQKQGDRRCGKFFCGRLFCGKTVVKGVVNLSSLAVVNLASLYCVFSRKKGETNTTKHCSTFATPLPQVYHGKNNTTTSTKTIATILPHSWVGKMHICHGQGLPKSLPRRLIFLAKMHKTWTFAYQKCFCLQGARFRISCLWDYRKATLQLCNQVPITTKSGMD